MVTALGIMALRPDTRAELSRMTSIGDKNGVSPAAFVKQLKGSSSRFITLEFKRPFAWQEGYGVYSETATKLLIDPDLSGSGKIPALQNRCRFYIR